MSHQTHSLSSSLRFQNWSKPISSICATLNFTPSSWYSLQSVVIAYMLSVAVLMPVDARGELVAALAVLLGAVLWSVGAIYARGAVSGVSSGMYSAMQMLAGGVLLDPGSFREVGSLAGHLGLSNLVIMYDSNGICLDGTTSECFTEDTAKRFEAYGFRVMSVDGYDFDQMENVFAQARASQPKIGAWAAALDLQQGGNQPNGEPPDPDCQLAAKDGTTRAVIRVG